jgi:hypothetical protein
MIIGSPDLGFKIVIITKEGRIFTYQSLDVSQSSCRYRDFICYEQVFTLSVVENFIPNMRTPDCLFDVT